MIRYSTSDAKPDYFSDCCEHMAIMGFCNCDTIVIESASLSDSQVASTDLVEVTSEDIRCAPKNAGGEDDPIARALRRLFPHAMNVYAGPFRLSVFLEPGKTFRAFTPPDVVTWMEKLDQGQPVTPITFSLDWQLNPVLSDAEQWQQINEY